MRNNGLWDFKQAGPFEHFGKFRFGAVGYAGGIPEKILLRGTGCAQMKVGTSVDAWGNCWGESPYGDDPNDQYFIALGIEYAESKGY